MNLRLLPTRLWAARWARALRAPALFLIGKMRQTNAFNLARVFCSPARFLYLVRTGYMHTGERVNPDFPDPNFENHFKVYKILSQVSSSRAAVAAVASQSG